VPFKRQHKVMKSRIQSLCNTVTTSSKASGLPQSSLRQGMMVKLDGWRSKCVSRDRLECPSRPRILFPPTHLTHNCSKNGATMPLLIMQFMIFCALFCALTWATVNMVSLHAFRWGSMITRSRSFLRTGLAWYDSNDSKYFEEYKYCTWRVFPPSPSTNNVLLDLACRQ